MIDWQKAGLLVIALAVTACGGPEVEFEQGADRQGHSAPSSFTVEANAAIAASLPLDDPQDLQKPRVASSLERYQVSPSSWVKVSALSGAEVAAQ